MSNSLKATNLGRISPLFKGNYDKNTKYERLDVVLFNGSSYICKQSYPAMSNKDMANEKPTKKNSKYWQCLAASGVPQDSQINDAVSDYLNNKTYLSTISNILSYDSEGDGYELGDLAINESKIYQCTVPTSGAWDSASWNEVYVGSTIDNTLTIGNAAADAKTVGDLIAPAFSSSNSYDEEDYVLVDGVAYKFINSHTGAWDSNDVDSINIGNELSNYNKELKLIQNNEMKEFYVNSTNGGYVEYETGTASSSYPNLFHYTDYFMVLGFSHIKYQQATTGNSTPAAGIVFYDINKNYISGKPIVRSTNASQYSEFDIIAVPENAVYARFTVNSSIGSAKVYGIYNNYDLLSTINKNIQCLQEKTNVINYDYNEDYLLPAYQNIGAYQVEVKRNKTNFRFNNSYNQQTTDSVYIKISGELDRSTRATKIGETYLSGFNVEANHTYRAWFKKESGDCTTTYGATQFLTIKPVGKNIQIIKDRDKNIYINNDIFYVDEFFAEDTYANLFFAIPPYSIYSNYVSNIWLEDITYNKDESIISNQLYTPVAVNSYDVDNYLMIGPNLYKTISSIASNDTLDSSNIEQTYITNELTSLNWFNQQSAKAISSIDLDDYTNSGNYKIINNTSAATVDNKPVDEDDTARLLVISTSNESKITQLYICDTSADSNIYYRNKDGNGTWTSWNKILTNNNFSDVLYSSEGEEWI